MEVSIDIDSDIPPFAQLVKKIRAAVESGELAPNAPLPSIRQLANDLRLNHNTVAKAYRKLEKERIVETKSYRGTFVHRDALANCATDASATAEAKLARLISKLRLDGLSDSELRSAFSNALKVT